MICDFGSSFKTGYVKDFFRMKYLNVRNNLTIISDISHKFHKNKGCVWTDLSLLFTSLVIKTTLAGSQLQNICLSLPSTGLSWYQSVSQSPSHLNVNSPLIDKYIFF